MKSKKYKNSNDNNHKSTNHNSNNTNNSNNEINSNNVYCKNDYNHNRDHTHNNSNANNESNIVVRYLRVAMFRHSHKTVCASPPFLRFFNVVLFLSIGMDGDIEDRGRGGEWGPRITHRLVYYEYTFVLP